MTSIPQKTPAESPPSAPLPIVVGITGASGAPYGRRLLECLLRAGREVHLSISPSAVQVFAAELGLTLDLAKFSAEGWIDAPLERLHYWHYLDFSAGIASGSFRTAAMAIVPCSMSSLASVASGITTNLIQRAADVHLKERRPLILTPRETPINLIGLENMVRAAQAGATILPAMPGFYQRPTTVEELVDFVVARICDHLGVAIEGVFRWGDQ